MSDLTSCPVCFEAMSPCMSFPCNHKVCGGCAGRLTACPTCRYRGTASKDHAMTEIIDKGIVNKHIESILEFVHPLGLVLPLQEQRRIIVESLERFDNNVNVNTRNVIVDELVEANELLLSRRGATAAPAVATASGLIPTATPTAASATPVYILWDFDQMANWDARDISALYLNLLDRLRSEGVQTGDNTSNVAKAFGVRKTFDDDRKVKKLQDLRIGTHLVSSAKKEETDRQLEREAQDIAAADLRATFVIISSDKDFNGLVGSLRRRGHAVYVVHNAKSGSEHSQMLRTFATASWHMDAIHKKHHAATTPPPAASPASSTKPATSGVLIHWKENASKQLSGFIKPDGAQSRDENLFVHINDNPLIRHASLNDRVSYSTRPNPQQDGHFMAVDAKVTSRAPGATPAATATAASGKRRPDAAPKTAVAARSTEGKLLRWAQDKNGQLCGWIQPDGVSGTDQHENLFVHVVENPSLRDAAVGARVFYKSVPNPIKPGHYKAIQGQCPAAHDRRSSRPTYQPLTRQASAGPGRRRNVDEADPLRGFYARPIPSATRTLHRRSPSPDDRFY